MSVAEAMADTSAPAGLGWWRILLLAFGLGGLLYAGGTWFEAPGEGLPLSETVILAGFVLAGLAALAGAAGLLAGNVTILVLRLFGGGLFLAAGALKIADPVGFLTSIEAYRIVPYPMAAVVAMGLPWLEVVAGAALLAGPLRGAAAWTLGAMMGTFTVLLLVSWGRGLSLACGCFGGDPDQPDPYAWLLARDLGLIALFVLLIVSDSPFRRPPNRLSS